MNARKVFSLSLTCALCLGLTATAHGSLTLSSGLGTSHVGNLVVNGSFEIGAPPNGTANWINWANPPSAQPPGWLGSGPNSASAWGNDGGPAPFRLFFSDDLPDGRAGIDFHTGTGTTVNVPPTIFANGLITFPSTPVFTFQPPTQQVNLRQLNIPTNAVPQPSYNLSFWVSGEENTTNQGNTGLGMIGMKMSNVLAGDPTTWLVVPNGLGPFGMSHLYEFTFTPLNPLNPVDIQFINVGGLNLTAHGGSAFGAQPVLDDVIINGVPEPQSLALLAGGAWALLAVGRRRRAARR